MKTEVKMSTTPAVATMGLKLLQPEIQSLIMKVGMMEQGMEEKQAELKRDRMTFEEEKQQFHEWMGAEKQKLKEEEDVHAEKMRWERATFTKEKEDFQEAQALGKELAGKQEAVTVEVGGEKFRTELRTLANCRGSVFPKLVEPLQDRGDKSKRDPYIFIDRDGKHFRFILNFLRQGKAVMRWSAMRNPDQFTLNEILDDVQYYKIHDLELLIKRKKVSLTEKISFEALVKAKYLVRDSIHPSFKTTAEHKFQDINLFGITFAKVDFCHPTRFQNCILTSAKFSECCFRKAIIFDNVGLNSSKFIHCEGLDNCTFINSDKSNIEIVKKEA